MANTYEFNIFKLDNDTEVVGLRMADDLPISMGGMFYIAEKLKAFRKGQYNLLAEFRIGKPRGDLRKPMSDDFMLTSVPGALLEELKNFLEP